MIFKWDKSGCCCYTTSLFLMRSRFIRAGSFIWHAPHSPSLHDVLRFICCCWRCGTWTRQPVQANESIVLCERADHELATKGNRNALYNFDLFLFFVKAKVRISWQIHMQQCTAQFIGRLRIVMRTTHAGILMRTPIVLFNQNCRFAVGGMAFDCF